MRIKEHLKNRSYKFYITTLAIILFGIWYTFCLPEKLFNKPTSTIIQDKNDELLAASIANDEQWRFPTIDSVPYKFKKCILQFEDRDFYSHPGFHFPALLRAAYKNLKEWSIVSGGSTITMQTIRLSRNNPKRTFFEKTLEIIKATRLELRTSKKRILQMYSSNAPFGGNVVGLNAASWRYYRCPPKNLSWGESATLAVLPNTPSLIYPGRNKNALKAKRNRLLKRLHEIEVIDSLTFKLAKQEPIPDNPSPLPDIAKHILNRAYKEGLKGKRIKTTINKDVQLLLNRVLAKHHKKLNANNIHNACALIAKVDNGAVLAYKGNTESSDKNDQSVDIITSPRSTGSILKPFLYASMMNDGEILPKTLFPDIPTNYANYSPKNYNKRYDGAVPANRALIRSLNVPAVRMLDKYGISRFLHKLQKMGFEHINKPARHYGLTLILGGAEASLWNIVQNYTSMAKTLKDYQKLNGNYNRNTWDMLHLFKEQKKMKDSIFHETGILNAASIYKTLNTLKYVHRPENETGWQTFPSSDEIAWKTGTSYGYRDAWAIGVTTKYVVGVWAGNADGEGREGLVGVKAAAPILFDIFDKLDQNNKWFKPPRQEMKKI
ncbi:MAG: penicillin-binding protein 1C, partial [Flavobacteriales bacterium]